MDLRKWAVPACLALSSWLLPTHTAHAVPPDFSNEVVVPGITAATTIAFLPDGRMLVGELTERIWVVQPGATQADPTPLLQLDSSQLFGEQGLMDIALDPDFATNQYYYIFYTHGAPGQQNHNRVSRFTASGNGTVPGSELVLWEDDLVANQEHHGGALAFGNDGKLYISCGEQFVPADAQSLTTYRGKLLRINRDGTIPTDNPFYDGPGPIKDEIWAYGLRNPYRMSVDPPTGRIFIGDVGGNDPSTAFEEVNLVARGANYGWPLCEGPCGSIPGVTSPIYSYPHLGRDACITGGFVYRGTQFPQEYLGSYFFADYVQNWIKRLTFDANGNVSGLVNFEPVDGSADGPYGDPVKLLQGPDGSLYYVDIGFNDQHVPNPAAIRRIVYTPANQPPLAVADAAPRTGQAPLDVTFSSVGSSDPEGQPLSFSWSFGDGASSNAPNPTHTYTARGSYVARLTVSDGVNQVVSNDVDIAVGNPPTATILTPANGTIFRAGDVISFSGTGSDVEDGVLPASAFSWTILFHHDTHIHPGGTFSGTKTGALTIPTSGHDFEGSTNYEFILTVTDSDGLSTSTSVTAFPDKVHLSFGTAPSGLAIDVDGIRKIAPFAFDDVIGFHHVLDAPVQQMGGVSYAFDEWSDGSTESHAIVVPGSAASWLATFRLLPESHLVAAYRFDEGSGTTAQDFSGNGNDGSVAGPTWVSNGKFGGALEFDGGSVVLVPDSSSLDLTTGMTLEAWVYPTYAAVTNDWRDVIYKGTDDIYYLTATSDQSGVPATGGTFTGPLYGTSALPLETWSHLAATYDGAMVRLYVNGVQVAARPQTGAIPTSNGALTFGGDPTYGQHFTGLIDEVQIYDRALGASEIQRNMNSPAPMGGFAVPALPLAGLAVTGAGVFATGFLALARKRARGVRSRATAARDSSS